MHTVRDSRSGLAGPGWGAACGCGIAGTRYGPTRDRHGDFAGHRLAGHRYRGATRDGDRGATWNRNWGVAGTGDGERFDGVFEQCIRHVLPIRIEGDARPGHAERREEL